MVPEGDWIGLTGVATLKINPLFGRIRPKDQSFFPPSLIQRDHAFKSPPASWGNRFVNKSNVTGAIQSMDGFKEGMSWERLGKGRYFYMFIRTKNGRSRGHCRQAGKIAQVRS